MTSHNFPPADQCDPEDLDNLVDLVVRDPSASWALAGSRPHIEALCRRYQALVQELAATQQRASDWASQVDSAYAEIRALTSTLDAERNERQGEVLQAEADRERADEAEAAAEVFEATARAALAILARERGRTQPVRLAELVRAVDGRVARALVRERQVTARLTRQVESMAMLLDGHQQTHAANYRIQSALAATCEAVTGKTVEEVNIELAANPEPGPLHHARDQRDHQEDTQ